MVQVVGAGRIVALDGSPPNSWVRIVQHVQVDVYRRDVTRSGYCGGWTLCLRLQLAMCLSIGCRR